MSFWIKATGIGRAVNRYRKHGNDIGDIASYLVTKWKELLKQEQGACQTSTSKSCDEEQSGSHLKTESKVDQINNKHEKSKHRTVEIKPKVCILCLFFPNYTVCKIYCYLLN